MRTYMQFLRACKHAHLREVLVKAGPARMSCLRTDGGEITDVSLHANTPPHVFVLASWRCAGRRQRS